MGQARVGLEDLLKEQLNVLASKRVLYADCRDATPMDPSYGAKLLLERMKDIVMPHPEDIVQVHWKGMDYELEQSALFLGCDGKARIYVDEIGHPIYVGTAAFLSQRFFKNSSHASISTPNSYMNTSFPDSIFDFVEFMTALFREQNPDMKIIITIDPSTIKPINFKIGSAEYYPDQPEWFSIDQVRDTRAFKSKLYSEVAAQTMAYSRKINDEKLTNAEIQILLLVQRYPHRGKIFIVDNANVPELSKAGIKLAFEERMQKFLIQERGETYYIRPQYANIPYSELCPAAYQADYREFFKRDGMQLLLEWQLALAQSQEEYCMAFKTLMQTSGEFQASFLQTDRCKEFLRKFVLPDDDPNFTPADYDSNFLAKRYVRFCLSYMPGGKELDDEIFSGNTKNSSKEGDAEVSE